MTGKTHIAGGAAAGACVGFALHLPINQLLVCCAAGGIGGLIPDLDPEVLLHPALGLLAQL